MEFEDKSIVCADCGQTFVHSAEDQSRYAERGFTNEPKRCRDCRAKRKVQSGGGGGGGGGQSRGPRREFSSGGGRMRSSDGGGARPQREFHEAVCAECGATTTVPFKPTQGRPVLCRDCFRNKRP